MNINISNPFIIKVVKRVYKKSKNLNLKRKELEYSISFKDESLELVKLGALKLRKISMLSNNYIHRYFLKIVMSFYV